MGPAERLYWGIRMLCCCLLLEESGFFVSSQEKMSDFYTNFCCSHQPALIISPTKKAL